jgi:uncharacterized membrane protein YraQ (UPF0718 family)
METGRERSKSPSVKKIVLTLLTAVILGIILYLIFKPSPTPPKKETSIEHTELNQEFQQKIAQVDQTVNRNQKELQTIKRWILYLFALGGANLLLLIILIFAARKRSGDKKPKPVAAPKKNSTKAAAAEKK